MKEYKRKYPQFALCGLSCGLCPRYHTDGPSRCPGCGGPDFHLKHPSCAVITCNKKHDNVEFCFECSSYPCERYKKPSKVDSFISYRNVLTHFKSAKKDIFKYKAELNEKIKILERLIKDYNDGRRKNFYCIAVNLLKLPDLKNIMVRIKDGTEARGGTKDPIGSIIALFEEEARKQGIELKLRK